MPENSSDLIICLDDNINIGYHITNILNKERHEKGYSSVRSKSSGKKFELHLHSKNPVVKISIFSRIHQQSIQTHVDAS
jgi:hypothetical protein